MQTVHVFFFLLQASDVRLRLLVDVQVGVVAQHRLYDGSVAHHLLAEEGDLVGEQAVLLQQHLHVDGEEVVAELVGQPHKVAHHVPALVDEQRGQGAVPEQLAGADARAAHAAELDARVLLREAQQAASHGLAARHVRLVDVDDDDGVPVLLVQRVQEVLAVVELVDLREAFDAVVVALHLLHALHAVLLQEGFVVVVVVVLVLEGQLDRGEPLDITVMFACMHGVFFTSVHMQRDFFLGH